MDNQKLTVRSVERALDILSCFTDSTNLGLTDISNRVSLHKSTVHRLLATLEGKGYIIRNPATDKYRLGFQIWELSANLTHTDDPATLFLPEMEGLQEQLGETISLNVLDGNERIRIQAVQSHQSIRRVAPIGARLPLYVGASSKVLIAYADIETQQRIINDVNWPITIERQAFLKQLDGIKQSGYATSVEEREPGAAAVAAPIMNRNGNIVASLSVSGPANRLTVERMSEHAEQIMAAAKRMGKMIK